MHPRGPPKWWFTQKTGSAWQIPVLQKWPNAHGPNLMCVLLLIKDGRGMGKNGTEAAADGWWAEEGDHKQDYLRLTSEKLLKEAKTLPLREGGTDGFGHSGLCRERLHVCHSRGHKSLPHTCEIACSVGVWGPNHPFYITICRNEVYSPGKIGS